MKTLLRDVSSGCYFEGPGKWTSNPRAAFDFKMIDRALRFVQAWHLENVEIAFAFESEVKTVPAEKIGLGYSES